MFKKLVIIRVKSILNPLGFVNTCMKSQKARSDPRHLLGAFARSKIQTSKFFGTLLSNLPELQHPNEFNIRVSELNSFTRLHIRSINQV